MDAEDRRLAAEHVDVCDDGCFGCTMYLPEALEALAAAERERDDGRAELEKVPALGVRLTTFEDPSLGATVYKIEARVHRTEEVAVPATVRRAVVMGVVARLVDALLPGASC